MADLTISALIDKFLAETALSAGEQTTLLTYLDAINASKLSTGTLPGARIGTRKLIWGVDNAGTALSTGLQTAYIAVPWACTLTANTLLADQSGSVVLDLWKDTYANFPPVVGDSICASAKPTLSTARKSTDGTLTGWTTTCAAGDIIFVNIDSAATCTAVNLILDATLT